MNFWPECEGSICVCFWRWDYLHCRSTDKCIPVVFQLLLLTSHSGNRLLSITNKKLFQMTLRFHVKTDCKQILWHSTFFKIFLLKWCLFSWCCIQAGSAFSCLFFFLKQFSSRLRVSKYTFCRHRMKFWQIYILALFLCSCLVSSPFFGVVFLFCLANRMAIFEASLCLTFYFPSTFNC